MMEVFWCIFALPSPERHYLPKCKSQTSRSAAFDLLIEMTRGSLENYAILHTRLVAQHSKGTMTCTLHS